MIIELARALEDEIRQTGRRMHAAAIERDRVLVIGEIERAMAAFQRWVAQRILYHAQQADTRTRLVRSRASQLD